MFLVGCNANKSTKFDAEGYFVKTENDFIIVNTSESKNFKLEQVVKIRKKNDVTFKGFNNGDKIGIKFNIIMESHPPIVEPYELKLIKKGNMSNISSDIKLKLKELGLNIVE